MGIVQNSIRQVRKDGNTDRQIYSSGDQVGNDKCGTNDEQPVSYRFYQ
jgi:hypothetical protein